MDIPRIFNVSVEKVDVAACGGTTWIAGGVTGTIELLAQSLRTGGIILIGEPYWRRFPPTEAVARGCLANSISDFLVLPELTSEPKRYATYPHEYLGWGMFAPMPR